MWDDLKKAYNVQDGDVFDWNQFGQDISVFLASVGNINFLYINLSSV